jgi:sRNA-binding protein
MMKKKKWQQVHEQKMVGFRTLEYITEKWPKAFVKLWDGNSEHKALAIGIHNEIWEHFKAKVKWPYDIKIAMGLYCNSPKYHKAMLTVGKSRVDLDGKVVGKIWE